MKVNASLKNLRIAPRKSKLVADLIRGLDVKEALKQLDLTVKGSVPHMKKLLESAIANGENNFGIDRDNMYIYEVRIGAGPVFKRWMPKAFGRAGQILKRTTKIDIILEERVEGKNRKTKDQMEKEKKEKEERRKKETQQRNKEEKQENEAAAKKEKTDIDTDSKDSGYAKKELQKKGWANKIFRRKSM